MKHLYQEYNFKYKKDLERLERVFSIDSLFTIDDYVDLFLRMFRFNYRRHFIAFLHLLKSHGYNLTTCQLNDLIINRLIKGDYESYRLKNIYQIDKMSGFEFEIFLGRFFKSFNSLECVTQKSQDKGVDLIIYLNGKRTVVQAKRWKKNVGIKAIQEVYTAKALYHADNALVISSAKFSPSAIKTAEKLNVELWDRRCLIKKLQFYGFYG